MNATTASHADGGYLAPPDRYRTHNRTPNARWVYVGPDGRTSKDSWPTQWQASDRAHAEARRASIIVRTCISWGCNSPVRSTHAGHRMCDKCRLGASDFGAV